MKVLIVGLGSIAQKHIKALRELDSKILIYALRSSRTAKNYEGIIDLFSIEDAKNIKCDFAIVSTPTAKHKESIEDLIDLNVPLFIEKPLHHNLSILNTVLSLNKMNTITYVACNLRFLNCLNFTKEYIKDKRVNEVNSYCGSYLPEWRSGVDYKKNYSAIPELGGGVQLDLIHELDYLYWIFGTPNIVRSTFSNNSSLNVDAIDFANYCLSYDNFSANVILNYYRRDSKRTLEVVCDDETLFINLLSNEVYAGKKMIFKSKQNTIDTYKAQMKYFLTVLSKKEITTNTIQDAFNVLKISLNQNAEK